MILFPFWNLPKGNSSIETSSKEELCSLVLIALQLGNKCGTNRTYNILMPNQEFPNLIETTSDRRLYNDWSLCSTWWVGCWRDQLWRRWSTRSRPCNWFRHPAGCSTRLLDSCPSHPTLGLYCPNQPSRF